MQSNRSVIRTIGYGLACLYAVSLWAFLLFQRIPELPVEWQMKSAIYAGLFAFLLVGSVAVAMLKEWGRKLILVLNAIMFIGLLMHYLPKVDLVPLSYFILNIIVFLYFTQNQIKVQFTARPPLAWKSILIVDDDETLIRTVRPILIGQGFSVLTANTGEDGLVIARQYRPDLIILDVILPGIKGRDVCKNLKQDPVTKDIPVIFMTAKDSADDVRAELEAGAITHLTKPVDRAVLIATVENVLKLRSR